MQTSAPFRPQRHFLGAQLPVWNENLSGIVAWRASFASCKMSFARTLCNSASNWKLSAFHVPPLVISGCSGAGKSTHIERLLREFPGHLELSVSHTTRQRRPTEEDGRHYHFVGLAEMQQLVAKVVSPWTVFIPPVVLTGIKGDFLEVTQYGRDMYGTSLSAVMQVAQQRKICAMDLDVNGVETLRRLNVASNNIFLSVPSLGELRARLMARGDTTPQQLADRLVAAAELLPFEQRADLWDAVIQSQINADDTYALFRSKVLEWYPFVEADVTH